MSSTKLEQKQHSQPILPLQSSGESSGSDEEIPAKAPPAVSREASWHKSAEALGEVLKEKQPTDQSIADIEAAKATFAKSKKNRQSGADDATSLSGVALTWKDVTFTVKDKKTKKPLNLLDHVSGIARPGTMTAVMGPSGCGKTTLLDTLAGRVKSSRYTGDITVNGYKRGKEFTYISSYVMQDDALIGSLTVRENLMFSARLRLPRNWSERQRKERVNEVIEMLGLQAAADRYIGDVIRRGISGGQRRRVSIGAELLTRPAVLFLDEPTSGLDSKSSFSVMRNIQAMARMRQKTVICTIHQPSSETFALFDQVVLLTRGRLVYSGPIPELPAFFAANGVPVPNNYNIADHALNVTNTDFSDAAPSRVEETRESEIADAIELSEVDDSSSASRAAAAAAVDEVDGAVGSSKLATTAVQEVGPEERVEIVNRLVSAFRASSVNQSNLERITQLEAAVADGPDGAGGRKGYFKTWKRIMFPQQVFVLAWRQLVANLRNPAIYWVRLIMYSMLAILMGLLYLHMDLTQKSIQDRLAVLFFSAAFLTFMSISALPAMIEERLIFTRERANGYYGTAAYMVANTVIGTPFVFLIALVFTVIMYPIVWLNFGSPEQFFYFLINLSLALFVAEGFMIMCSTITSSFIVATAVGAGVYGFSMLVCGFFVRADNIGPWLIWAHWISFHKYAFEGLMVNEFLGQVFRCTKINNGTFNYFFMDSGTCFHAGNCTLTEQGRMCAAPTPVNWTSAAVSNMTMAGNSTLELAKEYLCYYQSPLAPCGKMRGKDVIDEFGYDYVPKWGWVGVLVVFGFFFRFMAFLILKLRSSKR